MKTLGLHGSHPAYQRGTPLHSVSLSGWSYRHNFCEHIGLYRGFESALFNKIHPNTQEVRKIVLEVNEIKQRSRAIKFHKNVHITCFFLLAPNIRPEDPKVRNAITLPEGWQVCMKILPDLINRPLFLKRTDFGHGHTSL